MFDSRQVLIAAKHLVGINGIEVAHDLTQVSYFHILFDRHEVIFANQTASESLYTGPQALKSLSQEAREEIFALFPELVTTNHKPQSCRPIAEGRVLRRLLCRHQSNNKDLLGYQAKQARLS
jgi:hypothetical protein